MTDTYPGFFGGYPTGEPAPHRSHLLQVARIVLAVAGISLVFFLLQWTTAVRVAPEDYLPQGTLEEYKLLNGKTVRVQWQPAIARQAALQMPESRVVVPQYAGGGRGSTLIGFNAWRFGTIREHPVWFGACVALLLAIAAGFAICTWYASHPEEQAAAESPAE